MIYKTAAAPFLILLMFMLKVTAAAMEVTAAVTVVAMAVTVVAREAMVVVPAVTQVAMTFFHYFPLF